MASRNNLSGLMFWKMSNVVPVQSVWGEPLKILKTGRKMSNH